MNRAHEGTYRKLTSDFSYQLTCEQQRRWFLEKLHPNHVVNRAGVRLRISGKLDISLLTDCLNQVLQQHEVLASLFAAPDGQPVATIRATRAFVLPFDDLSQLSPAQRATRSAQLATGEWNQVMDLAQGPLVTARLIRLAPEEHRLLLVAHRIVADPHSLRTIAKEAFEIYARQQNDSVSTDLEPRATWAEFIAEMEEFRSGPAFKAEMEFWRAKLNDNPAPVEIPADQSRPPLQSYDGASVSFTLPEICSAAISALAASSGLSRSQVIATIFAGLIHRYTRQEQVLIGWVVPARSGKQDVGPLENTIVLRFDFSGEPSLENLLRRTAAETSAARANSGVDFASLLQVMPEGREMSRPPLVQVACVFADPAATTFNSAGLAIQEESCDAAGVLFDLALQFPSSDNESHLRLDYNRHLFSAETIERFAAHFKTLAESCLRTPGEALGRMPLLPEPERRKLLVEWNRTAVDFPRSKCIHELFEEQVQRTPNAIALVFEDQQLTYGELNRRADALAQQMRHFGVGPDVCAGICMLRSPEMVIAMYAVLKAGGAYVPMDPNYPAERLAFMAEDADVPVLLTQSEIAGLLPATRARVLCFDADGLKVLNEAPVTRGRIPIDETGRKATAENLAYVIYTSGSTGKPKGVMIRHRNAVNFFTGMDGAIGSAPGVWLAITSISFDIHVLELLWTLTRGFKVVLQGDERAGGRARKVRANGSADRFTLAEQIKAHAVSHLQCTPSLAVMMLNDAATRDALGTVSRFFFGGEVLPPTLVEQLRDRSEVFNMYGPTETTVWSTVHHLKRNGGAISIGRPIANTRVYILDAAFEPVPIGVPGELFIGGEGVARGYLKRPELTAERFVADPFGSSSEDRMYRTGDLARWLPDGTIEFLGRIDHQVKVRGFRIELGEIETALRQHPEIREAVVSVWKAGAEDTRLGAWYVSHAGTRGPGSSELRRHLQARLPDYMIPSCFVQMEALPLTPNGKIDRKALPLPKIQAEPEEESAPTVWEQRIGSVCREVLAIDTANANLNFLAHCPDLVSITQLHTRLVERLEADIPLAALLQFPTVRALGKFLHDHKIDGRRAATAPNASRVNEPMRDAAPAPRFEPKPQIRFSQPQRSPGSGGRGEVQKTLPLTEGQREIWLASQISDQLSCSFNQSEMLKLEGDLDSGRLRESVAALVQRHEALRVIFPADGDRQIILDQMPLNWRWIDLSGKTPELQEAEVDRICKEERECPFDLAAGPLCRGRLLKLGRQQHLLMLTVHHIICDGASLAILFRDLAQEYLEPGESLRRGSRDLSYSEFVAEQVASLQTPERAQAEAFWLKEFSTTVKPLALPLDRPETRSTTSGAGSERLIISRPFSDQIKRMSTARGRTLTSTLLAAYSLLLYRLSGQLEFVVGLPVSNRSGPGSERVIGHCINFLPLRLSVDPESTLDGHVSRVWDSFVSALENQNFTLGALLEAMERSRERLQPQLVSVMFNLDWTDQSPLELGNVRGVFERNPYCYSRFQFSLSIAQRSEGLELYCEYNADVLSREAAGRWLRHYETILRELAAKPNEPLRNLPSLLRPDGTVEIAAPDSGGPVPRSKSSPPIGADPVVIRPEEEKLARIFCEVIGIDEIGRNESFFDVGGHSLLATKIVARVAKTFEVDLPLRAIFEAPSIAELAPQIDKARQQHVRTEPLLKADVRDLDKEKLLERLNQLSEAELQELLRNPNLDLL